MTDNTAHASAPAERHWRALLAAIVLLAVVLRLYGLGRFSIWYDESTSIFALQYVDWDLRFLKAEETRLIPLNTLFLFFWYALVERLPGVHMGSQASDFLLHVLPGTFSALTVPLVFALGRRVTGRASAGLAAALITAISPFHLYYASELGPHSLYAITVLLSVYCNYRALEENKLRYWIGSVVFEALSFYAYYFSVFYLAAVNLFVLVNFRAYRPVFKRWIVCQALAGALVLPAILLAMFVFQMHASAAAHWFPYPTLKTLLLTVKDWFAGYSPRPAVYWPLFLLGVVAFALGAASLKARPRALAFLAFAAFLPPFIQYVFWNTQGFAFYTMRIQLAYSLPAYVLAGAGLTAAPWLRARLALLAVLAAFTAPALADHFAQRIHPVFEHRMGVRYKVDNRGAAEFVRAHRQDNDVIAHASTVTLGPFLYHYLDLDAPQVFAIAGQEEWDEHLANYPDMKVWESLGFLPERIDELVHDAPPVWLVSAGWETQERFTHGILLRSWLDAHGTRLKERHDGEVDVYLFDLASPPRTNRVADLGWYAQLGPAPDMRAANVSLFPPARDPGALDVWFEDAPGAAVRLRNRSTNPRSVAVSVRRAFDVRSSLAFDREPGSDVWRPILGSENRAAQVARVSPDQPAGTLSRALPPGGPWDVYIEIAGESETSEAVTADLYVEWAGPDGTPESLATIVREDTQRDDLWRWTPAGRIPAMADGARLMLRASLPAGQDAARIQLGNVALVPASDSAWSAAAETVALAPVSEITMNVTVPESSGEAAPVVWYEFYDAEYRVHRELSRYEGDAP